MYLEGSVACEPTWNDRPSRHAEAACLLDQAEHCARLAAELLGQVADGGRAAEADPDQELGTLAVAHELADLVRVVDDEGRDAEAQRVANVAVALDRVRVDAALRGDALRLDQLDLAGRRQVEEGALVPQRRNDRRVRQRLERVVQVDARQSCAQGAVLAADLFAIDDQQRRAETGCEPADLSFRQRRRVEGVSGRYG
jgi:hypothetical protein